MRRVLGGQFGKARSAGLGVLIAAASVAATIAGCGSDSGTGTNGFSTGAGGASGSAGTISSGSKSGGTGGDDFDPSGTSTGTNAGSTGTGDSCAATSAEANLIPVNMFIIFDKSGSMKDNNKWDNTTKALIDFFKDQGSAGLRVALRFFPDSGCDDTACDIPVCSQPLVALAPLTTDTAPADTQEQKLIDAVNSKSPNGGTPMYVALGGAEKWAADYQTAHPAEKTVVVLVTDGEPNGCDENVSHIAKLAATTMGANGVLTYAVGLAGSNQGTMDTIAAAGGTSQGIQIGNGNASAELLAALKAIQGSQVACTFQMPAMGSMGEIIDPTLVNVNYTPGDGGPTVEFGQVADKAACTPQKGGWFYDNPAKPTTITLCPTTCTSVQADEQAKIQILLGCATKPAQ
jgi:von Willebrand factor type A domain-containing protein